MRFVFRPMPLLTVVSLAALGLLLWLGIWQTERLSWKLDLIAAAEEARLSEPLPIEEALEQALQQGALSEYRRVEVKGTFDHSREAYLFTSKGNLGVGFQVLTPMKLESGKWVLVDRGFIPQDRKDPATRAEGQVGGEVQVIGLLRHTVAPGIFTPAADLDENIWYARDIERIGTALGLSDPLEVMVDADASPNPGGWPKGGQTIVEFTNNHLGYALTWFGMAIALLVIYVIFHYKAGRLKFVPKG